MAMSAVLKTTIDRLKPRFIVNLTEWQASFRALRPELSGDADLPPLLHELRFATHRMAGLAGTLGFRALGRLAQQAEARLVPLTDAAAPARPLPPAVLASLDALMREMDRVVADASPARTGR